MKTKILIFAIIFFFIFSCNEDKILKETPLDFYSIENAYVNANDFQSAINRLYAQTRSYYTTNYEGVGKEIYFIGTDLCVNAISPDWPLNNYNSLVPTDGYAGATWTRMYKLIFDSNVIISEIEKATFDNTVKTNLKAEALFFRAFAYRCLANLFGGVPLVLTEVTSPARDYVRATRDEVYKQCASDLEFAAANLKDVTAAIDGQVNKATANHLLSEIYICLQQWDKAISAASAAINNPALKLMTSRFGSKVGEPGDVISDLFRYNNQNRSSGNTEGLWVLQYDYKSQGSPYISWEGADIMQSFVNCFYTNVILDDGKNAIPAPYQQLGGWGIGWYKTTPQAVSGVWKSDFNIDIRNSQYNIVRDAKVMNPDSKYYGKYLEADHLVQSYDTTRNWYPIYTKASRWNDFPADVVVDQATGEVKYDVGTNKDEYVFRLAETYLLRAEAYLGKGDKQNAANDINVIRARANATPVNAENVNIDYILDERLRELPYEELRLFTLTRLGKLVDRVKKYNYYATTSIKDHMNLYPIPFSEIERNTLATLEQNPGY